MSGVCRGHSQIWAPRGTPLRNLSIARKRFKAASSNFLSPEKPAASSKLSTEPEVRPLASFVK